MMKHHVNPYFCLQVSFKYSVCVPVRLSASAECLSMCVSVLASMGEQCVSPWTYIQESSSINNCLNGLNGWNLFRTFDLYYAQHILGKESKDFSFFPSESKECLIDVAGAQRQEAAPIIQASGKKLKTHTYMHVHARARI